MDTHLANNNEGLEFIALKDLTPDQLVGQLSNARVMIELSKGFGIVAFANQYNPRELIWISLKVAEG